MACLLAIVARLSSNWVPPTPCSIALSSSLRILTRLLLRQAAIASDVSNAPAIEASPFLLNAPLNRIDGFGIKRPGVNRSEQAAQLFVVHLLVVTITSSSFAFFVLIHALAVILCIQNVPYPVLMLDLLTAYRVDDPLAKLFVGLAFCT